MYDFHETRLWLRTLAQQGNVDKYPKQRELLRTQFEDFREKAATIADQIHTFLPEYTVHDITHIDMLWKTASLIVPEDMEINPAEAFVLGGAFLLHDLGMAAAAYPNGMEDIKKDPIWIDKALSLLKSELGKAVSISDLEHISKEIEHSATELTLRMNHAPKAEELAQRKWDYKGESFYLIGNEILRTSYGELIGKIAHSHWWSIELIEEELSVIRGSISQLPPEWTVDPLKLACILRIADAIQLDDTRAPLFLMVVRKPEGISEAHWTFQNKLNEPRLNGNRLSFTSKSSFTINDMDAWWLCYDLLKQVNKELTGVEILLRSRGLQYSIFGIDGIEDECHLSKLITVSGWQPVDTTIRVGNVARLVKMLGGEELYGDDVEVPLREMIQNAADAIRARRLCEGFGDEYGDIVVSLEEDENGKCIKVEDNGIGMSREVLTGPFLDFGQTFWGTELMHTEFPGLEAKGMSPTGKFGIGFNSLFMWGDHVKVTTKKYTLGSNETLVLEFTGGVDCRPLLRKAAKNELITNGGTHVRVWPNSDAITKLCTSDITSGFLALIGRMCPAMDCNIDFLYEGKRTRVISANEWIKMPRDAFMKKMIRFVSHPVFPYRSDKDTIREKESMKFILKNIEYLKNEKGTIVGRAAINTSRWNRGCGIVTAGGLYASSSSNFLGILVGECTTAARDEAKWLASGESLRRWVYDQIELVEKTCTEGTQYIASSSSYHLCEITGHLKIAYFRGQYMSSAELAASIASSARTRFYIGEEWFDSNATYKDNVIFTHISPFIIKVNDNGEEKIALDDGTAIYRALLHAWEIRDISELTAGNGFLEREKAIGKTSKGATIYDDVYVVNKPKCGNS